MRAMIVDDEAPARSELHYLLDETGRVESITEASSAREAVEKLMEAKADVMFLRGLCDRLQRVRARGL